VFVSLFPQSNLYIHGKCEILVLKGIVEINGFRMSSENASQKIYSPKGYSLLCISAIASDNESTSMATTLPPNFSIEDLKDCTGPAFILKSFDDCWCDGIRSYCMDGESLVGPRVNKNAKKFPKLKNFFHKLGFQFVSNTGDRTRVFEAKSEWYDLFDEIVAKQGI